ncbi:PREDICTED: cysteine-rich venom protein 1-like [Nicrophorus vespilloides]|uniref:Cysteine-rich venom protein 1-like n=1 Tax=Nicrophorus vespilloides TaxID=110193 RepID=A0ABM1NJI2_NICVS|nr:PREDICTED: cysteine-rich venom protein 1-like [Nicrophorus vespilloides]
MPSKKGWSLQRRSPRKTTMNFLALTILLTALLFAHANSYSTPEKCGELEEYLVCGKECEDVCQDTGRAPLFCTARCKRGCFCKSGYLKDLSTGKCVEPKDCPPR